MMPFDSAVAGLTRALRSPDSPPSSPAGFNISQVEDKFKRFKRELWIQTCFAPPIPIARTAAPSTAQPRFIRICKDHLLSNTDQKTKGTRVVSWGGRASARDAVCDTQL